MEMSNSDQNANGNTGKSCVHNCQFFGSENRQAYLNTHTSGSWLGFIVYLRTIQEHWVKAVSVGVSLNDGLIKGFMDLFKLSIIDCWPLSAAFLEARRGLGWWLPGANVCATSAAAWSQLSVNHVYIYMYLLCFFFFDRNDFFFLFLFMRMLTLTEMLSSWGASVLAGMEAFIYRAPSGGREDWEFWFWT